MTSIQTASTNDQVLPRLYPQADSISADPAVVASLLANGKGKEALQEAIKGDSLLHPNKNEILETVAEFHLQRGELSQAKEVAEYMSGIRMDRICRSILKAELRKGDLQEAEKMADSMVISRDWAFSQIFHKKLKEKDFQGALFTALKTTVLKMAHLLQLLFDICLDEEEYEIVKQAFEQMNWRTQECENGLNKILDAELEKNDFVAAIKTCRLLSTQESAQKIADRLEQAKLDLKDLKAIDIAVNDVGNDLAVIILLHALKSAYGSLNEAGEVTRLEEDIQVIHEEIKVKSAYGSLNEAREVTRLKEDIQAILEEIKKPADFSNSSVGRIAGLVALGGAFSVAIATAVVFVASKIYPLKECILERDFLYSQRL